MLSFCVSGKDERVIYRGAFSQQTGGTTFSRGSGAVTKLLAELSLEVREILLCGSGRSFGQ
jgi:hypothetical protein